MRKLLMILGVLLVPLTASAQRIGAGTLDAASETVCTDPLSQSVAVTFQIQGTFVGTITFQGTGTSTMATVEATNTATGTTAGTTTAAGIYGVTNLGYTKLCATMTAYTSGGANIVITRGYGAGGAGGSGGGGGGDVNITEVGGNAVTTTVPVSGTVTVTDGAGALNVIVDSGTVAATQSGTWTVQPGNTANTTAWLFTGGFANDGVAAGTNRINTNPGLVETSAPTRTNGRNAGFSFLAGGGARVVITNDAGASQTLATDQTLDAAIGTTGPLMTGRGSAATPTAMSADNDDTALWLTLTGAVHTAVEGVEDVAETAGAPLAMAGSVRRDAAATSSGATGENATINTDALGQVWTRQLDPCSGVAKLYLPINIATATTTEITASLAGASNHYYVCSINIGPVAGAQTLALVDDDTDGCGSVTSGLAGGTTAATGWSIAANGGLTFGNGQSSIARTNGTNRVLCLVSGAAVQTSGVITVVAAP